MFPSLVIPKLHLDVGNLLQMSLPVQELDQVISRVSSKLSCSGIWEYWAPEPLFVAALQRPPGWRKAFPNFPVLGNLSGTISAFIVETCRNME